MILYHGTNTEIAQIDLMQCRPFKDFGRAFYLSEIRLLWCISLRGTIASETSDFCEF